MLSTLAKLLRERRENAEFVENNEKAELIEYSDMIANPSVNAEKAVMP